MSDVLVIGAGVNGLTAACALAKAGRRVTVLEATERVGGLAASESFAEGFTAPGLLQDTAAFHPAVEDALDLASHGLARRDAPTPVWGPAGQGDGVWIRGREVTGDLPESAQRRFQELHALLDRLRPAIAKLLTRPAPDPQGPLPPLVGAAWAVRRLGAADLTALTRIAPMAAGDWLRDSLDGERLRAMVALPALTGSYMGPWSAGSAGNLLLHLITADRPVVGGPAAVVSALSAAADALGVEVRTGARVEAVAIRQGRACGVRLRGGEELEAPVVASSCDPRRTFLGLVGAQRLPARFAHAIRNWRCRGLTAVRLAMSEPLRAPDGRPLEALTIGDSLDALERSFDAAKHRRPFAQQPAMQIRQPTVERPELTDGADAHVVTALVHGVPADVDGGWTDEGRRALGEAVTSALERACPGAADRVAHRQVLTPADIAQRWGVTGGHLFHGEHAPDQLLFMRPHLSCSRHATPIEGLWLCGAGAHPGGGVTGAPGFLAAQAILGA